MCVWGCVVRKTPKVSPASLADFPDWSIDPLDSAVRSLPQEWLSDKGLMTFATPKKEVTVVGVIERTRGPPTDVWDGR